jgi:biotin carboxyl carrier protein
VLARIDDRDFKVALDQAKADVAAAKAAIASKQAQLDVQQAVIDAAKATIDVDEANAPSPRRTTSATPIWPTGYGSVQNAQARNRASPAPRRDRARHRQPRLRHQAGRPAQGRDRPGRSAAGPRPRGRSTRPSSISYTTITAPIDGVVGNRTLRVGQYVQAGTQLMAVVPLQRRLCVANFKETQLTDVRTPASRSRSRSTCSRASPCTAMSTASRRPAARNSRCCRRTTPPATSPRSCSASRSRSCSTATTRAGELRPGMSVIRPSRPSATGAERRRGGSRRREPRAIRTKRRLNGSCHVHPHPDTSADRAALPSPTPPPIPTAPALKTWIAVIGAMIGAFMAILNIQIVNASLLDIEGGIGAGIDNGGWISTSYLIGEIVVIPLTGWLAGCSRSAAICWPTRCCSWCSRRLRLHADLPQMIVLRACRAFSGGVLIPMAFTLVITCCRSRKQPIGLAMFALSATFAPAIGPTIGGYLTENYGWQYIFYVNVVPGAHGRHAVVLAGSASRCSSAAARGRLARHRHHGDRPVRAADRARGRQQGRLVRLALHRRLPIIAAVSLTLFIWIELTSRRSR